ncbi:MAG: hypothetical protein N2512_09885 [Armatimonadetes bacterium]|nr:hypothetical protein [Armatimonadota bacterium]
MGTRRNAHHKKQSGPAKVRREVCAGHRGVVWQWAWVFVGGVMLSVLASAALGQNAVKRIEVLSPSPGVRVEQWSGIVWLQVRLAGLPAGGPPPWVTANIRRPTGAIRHEALVDDGSREYADEVKGDGIYSGFYDRCDVPGVYHIEMVKVSSGAREWSFPTRVAWEVIPAEPISVEVRTQAGRPWEVAVEAVVKSRYWGALNVKVATESGAGQAAPPTGTVAHYGDFKTVIKYNRAALQKLMQGGNARLVGRFKRGGRFSDTVMIGCEMAGSTLPAVKAPVDGSFSLPWYHAYSAALFVLFSFVILAGLWWWRAHEAARPALTGELRITFQANGTTHVETLGSPARIKEKSFRIKVPGAAGPPINCHARTFLRRGEAWILIKIGDHTVEVNAQRNHKWTVQSVGTVEYHWAK